MVALLFKKAVVESEINSGYGRCDIIIKFLNKSTAIIIELKHLKGRQSSETMESSALSALKQIHKQDYIEVAKKEQYKEVILYGMAFSNKNVVVKKEKINL